MKCRIVSSTSSKQAPLPRIASHVVFGVQYGICSDKKELCLGIATTKTSITLQDRLRFQQIARFLCFPNFRFLTSFSWGALPSNPPVFGWGAKPPGAKPPQTPLVTGSAGGLPPPGAPAFFFPAPLTTRAVPTTVRRTSVGCPTTVHGTNDSMVPSFSA